VKLSPNPPDPPADSPEDEGQPLGAFPLDDGGQVLRVTLKTSEGRPYVAIRLWSRDDRGRFRPVKGKGVSVRLREVSGVIDALQGALASAGELDSAGRRSCRGGRPLQGALASAGELDRQRQRGRPAGGGRSAGTGNEPDSRGGQPGGTERGPGFVDRRGPDRADWRAADLPPITSAGRPEGFDECGPGGDRP